jgi:sec-independent protein translocase protein TatA
MNVFGIGLPELAVIAAIALLVFGPKRLPEFGKTLGRTLKGFQSASSEFEREFRASLVTPDLDPGDERSLTQAAAPVAQTTAVAQQASVNPVADPQPVQSPAIAAGDDPSGSADPPASLPVGDVSPLA